MATNAAWLCPMLPFSGLTIGSRRASREAADAGQSHADTDRQRVLALLRRMTHGLTDSEIQAVLRMDGNTERPRRVELLRAGLIRESGETRQTLSGRRATVWVAAEEPC